MFASCTACASSLRRTHAAAPHPLRSSFCPPAFSAHAVLSVRAAGMASACSSTTGIRHSASRPARGHSLVILHLFCQATSKRARLLSFLFFFGARVLYEYQIQGRPAILASVVRRTVYSVGKFMTIYFKNCATTAVVLWCMLRCSGSEFFKIRKIKNP